MNTLTITPEDDVSAIIGAFGAVLKDPARAFTLLVRFSVNEADQERAGSAFSVARRQTLEERGVLAFELHQEAADRNSFVVYERWKSLAQLEAHLRMPHTTQLRDEFESIIVRGPQFIVLTDPLG